MGSGGSGIDEIEDLSSVEWEILEKINKQGVILCVLSPRLLETLASD